MRQLLDIARKRFPQIEVLHGRRISGARGDQPYAVQRVRIKPEA